MFQRRLKIIIFFWAVAVGLLITRLGCLQIIDGAQYVAEANEVPKQYSYWVDTVRGSIFDAGGRVLAIDEGSYELYLHYKLTRLYDERYWNYLRYTWEQDSNSRAASEDELNRQKKLADELLADLAQLCEVAQERLQEPIEKINNTIFNLCCSQARKAYFDEAGLEFYSEPTAAAIRSDLAEKIPDEAERLTKIFSQNLIEMRTPQWAMSLTEDVAFLVEERIVGASIHSGWDERPVSIRLGQKRVYPYEGSGCHIIGQLMPAVIDRDVSIGDTAEPNEAQLRLYQEGDRRGEWGVEYIFDQHLRGHRGWVLYNVDDNKNEREKPRLLGQDVRLTIDIELHRRIERIFGGDNDQRERYRGAAVIIDVPTGAIRAMVSAPTFDLNTYYHQDQYALLNSGDDPEKRKYNRALREIYMPGSTIKPTMLLTALEHNVVTPDTVIHCAPGSTPLTKRAVCFRYGHGPVNAKEAIKVSCNHYFMELAQQMGTELVSAGLKRAGFGARLLVWPEGISRQTAYRAFFEAAGYIQRSTPYVQDIGFISVGLTPLEGSIVQVANSMATIARDGVLVQPYLVLAPRVITENYRIFDPRHITTVKAGMEAVIYETSGTAYDAFQTWRWDREQIRLYGKTGSTDFSVFSGFAQGADGSSLALALVVEDDGGGGTVAAPVARRIWESCVELGYLGWVE